MNVKFVFYLVGNILILVSPLLGLCAIVAYAEASDLRDEEVLAFLIPATFMFALGGILSLSFRRFRTDQLLRRDGIGTVAFSWIIVCIIGAGPFVLLGVSPAKAIFESVSGFTTTGATIFDDIESLPNSILFWRSLMQWIGGIGILVFLVSLLSKLGIRGRALVGAESSVNIGSSATTKIKELAGHLLLVYLSLTVLCFILLLGANLFERGKISTFEALLYAMTTAATGGFAPHNDSVGHFDSRFIEGVIIVIMFISSVSFVLIYRAVSNREFNRGGRAEATGLLVIIIVVITCVTADLVYQQGISPGAALRQSIFPIVSMATSSGFGTVDYDGWPLMSKVFLAFVMIIGGCGGSTAGGLKVIRFILLIKILRLELQKTFRPNIVSSIRIDGEKIDHGVQYRALIYIVTVGFLLIFSTGVVSVMEPHVADFETAIGSVIATFFNMGPGFGDVGPTDHYNDFHSHTLLFLSWLMLLGRLEIFVLLALLTPALWKVR